MGTVSIAGKTFAIYGEADAARTYFAASTHGASWAGLSSTARNQALVTAARILERQTWVGSPTDPIDKSDFASQPANTQPLQWPRTGILDRNGVAVPDDVIPLDVVHAGYEIALELTIASPTIQTSSSAASNVKSERLLERVEGAVTVDESKDYWRESNAFLGGSRRFPTIIHELIGLWLSGAAVLAPEVSGNDGCSFIQGQDLGYTGYGIP